jgi:hypothetical protein
MLKPFRIDVNSLDGAIVRDSEIEIQGSMDVRPEMQPIEGVHQSTLHFSHADAYKLMLWLKRATDRAIAMGWKPPVP